MTSSTVGLCLCLLPGTLALRTGRLLTDPIGASLVEVKESIGQISMKTLASRDFSLDEPRANRKHHLKSGCVVANELAKVQLAEPCSLDSDEGRRNVARWKVGLGNGEATARAPK